MRMPGARCCALLLAALALSLPQAVGAQATPQRPPPVSAADGSQLTSHLVRTGLYLIAGGGANSLLRFSASGSILVDGKLPGNYRALMSQVRRISRFSDHPVRILIVTD